MFSTTKPNQTLIHSYCSGVTMPESSILIATEYVICIQVIPLYPVFSDNDGRKAYNYNTTDQHRLYEVVILN